MVLVHHLPCSHVTKIRDSRGLIWLLLKYVFEDQGLLIFRFLNLVLLDDFVTLLLGYTCLNYRLLEGIFLGESYHSFSSLVDWSQSCNGLMFHHLLIWRSWPSPVPCKNLL